MTLKLERLTPKESFGHERYRAACERSQDLAYLVGKKTFDGQDIIIIRRIGFTVEIENERVGR